MKEEGKKRKKEKKERTSQRRQWRRKKSGEGKKKWSKVAADPDSRFLYVCLITKMQLKIKLQKLKTAKMCFQFS